MKWKKYRRADRLRRMRLPYSRRVELVDGDRKQKSPKRKKTGSTARIRRDSKRRKSTKRQQSVSRRRPVSSQGVDNVVRTAFQGLEMVPMHREDAPDPPEIVELSSHSDSAFTSRR